MENNQSSNQSGFGDTLEMGSTYSELGKTLISLAEGATKIQVISAPITPFRPLTSMSTAELDDLYSPFYLNKSDLSKEIGLPVQIVELFIKENTDLIPKFTKINGTVIFLRTDVWAFQKEQDNQESK